MKNKTIMCANCGKQGVEFRLVTRSYGSGKNLLVIEGVPAIICSQCGETYFTPDTVRQLERIRRQRKSMAVARPVAVADFAAVAR